MDPTIVTLDADYPDPERDHHRVRESLESAGRLLDTLPVHYCAATADNPEVIAWVRALVEHAMGARRVVPAVVTGPSLLLLGATGTGKTHQAYGAIRALAVTGLRVTWRIVSAADLYAGVRPRSGVDTEGIFQRYAAAPLLVLDDLGAAKGTEWTEELNYRLINHRYEHELPTLITSNVPPRVLGDALGERVTSRLDEMTTRVVLKGDDRRRKAS